MATLQIDYMSSVDTWCFCQWWRQLSCLLNSQPCLLKSKPWLNAGHIEGVEATWSRLWFSLVILSRFQLANWDYLIWVNVWQLFRICISATRQIFWFRRFLGKTMQRSSFSFWAYVECNLLLDVVDCLVLALVAGYNSKFKLQGHGMWTPP